MDAGSDCPAQIRRTERYRFDWNGILLEVIYEPQWLPPAILGEDVAHLKVRSIYPTDVPLPFASVDTQIRPLIDTAKPAIN